MRYSFTALVVLSTALCAFDATIPVVDMNDFMNENTKQKFVGDVSHALHEVGFFAVVNTRTDEEELRKAYRSCEEFFSSSLEMKDEIWDPKLSGQRGYVHSETAQGAEAKDVKEFVHIGRHKNLWPTWMDYEGPMMNLFAILDRESIPLQQAFALALGLEENFFVDMTKEGECLMRALHYPKNPALGRMWASQHTDIDLFTILPLATEDGLQVWHNGAWLDVKVPPNAFIVNGGDFLQNISNGYFKSSLHRVVAKPDVERYSIVHFIHTRSFDDLSPTEHCIEMTGGVQRYPQAVRLELLTARLRELGLASAELLEWEKGTGFMDRVKELVDRGTASEPVKRTYSEWLKGQVVPHM